MILADFWLPGSGSVSLKRIRIRLTKMKRIRIRNTATNHEKNFYLRQYIFAGYFERYIHFTNI